MDREKRNEQRLAIARGSDFTRLHEYPDTLGEALVSAAERMPERGIVHVKSDGSEVWQSYPQLLEDAQRVLAGLRARSLQPGDKVIIEIQDSYRFLSVFWGCVLGGLVPVPLHVPASFAPDSNEMRKTKNVWELLGDPLMVVETYLAPKYAELQAHPTFASMAFTTGDELLAFEPDRDHHSADTHDLAFLQFSSGSTGDAKGVMLTHHNLRHNICSLAEAGRYGDDERFIYWMPFYHDMGLINFHLVGLFVGAMQVKMSPDTFVRRPALLVQKITQYGGTVTGSPNFGLDWMVTKIKDADLEGADLSTIHLLFNGAEPISIPTAEGFIEKFGRVGFKRDAMWYVYGMAEGCVGVAVPQDGRNCIYHTVDQQRFVRDKVIVAPETKDASALDLADEGQPLPGMELRICDDGDNVLPEGHVGHVQMRGPNVTAGYYKNPQANAALFADDWLRTGDLGFLLDGRLTISGRNKDVIFINGQNFYAHDIEEVVIEALELQHQSVIAIGVTDPQTGQEQVVLFLKWKKKIDDLLPLYQKIKLVISMELGFEIAGVLPISLIPKTTSGKLERFKLRQQFLEGRFDDLLAEVNQALREKLAHRDIVLPRTETERRLHRIIARVLDVPREELSVTEHFSSMASNSLKAMEMLREVEEWIGAGKITTLTLFDYPTIEQLANCIAEITNEGVLEAAVTKDLTRTITPLAEQESYAITSGQKGLWFIQQMQPDNVAYNEHLLLDLHGALDPAAFEASVQDLVDRHSALRTHFVETADGAAEQRIGKNVPASVRFQDLSHLSDEELATQLDESFRADMLQPFDLTRGPLFRFQLFKTGEERHRFQLVIHHIICDFASLHLLTRELSELYAARIEGREHALEPAAVQFVDYAAWKNAQLGSERHANMEQFWLNALAKPLPVLNLPTDLPRPAVQTYEGAVCHHEVNPALLARLRELCQTYNVSTYMVMLAVYFAWLHRVTDERDLIVGVPLSGRTVDELENVFGYFVNAMPMRLALTGDETFGEVLASVRQRVVEVLENQEYPFDQLVEKINPDRDLSRPVLFSTVFNMLAMNSIDWAHLDARILPSAKLASAVDLGFVVIEKEQEMYFDVEYNTRLFRPETVARFIRQYEKLVEAFLGEPGAPIGRADILTDADRQLYAALNDTKRPFPQEQTIEQRFQEMAAQVPDRPAISDEHVTISYRELNERSNQIAHILRERGIGRNTFVGLMIERSLDSVSTLLGVIKAGGAYVPIDPDYPVDRVRYMLEDSGAPLLLTRRHLLDRLPEERRSAAICLEDIAADTPTGNLETIVTPHDLAYMIYTSGSTGLPKGTKLAHYGVLNLMQAKRDLYAYTERDVILQFASFSFDASIWEVFPPLLNGARMHLINNEERQSVEAFADVVAKTGATVVTVPTVFFNQLGLLLADEDLPKFASMRYIFVAGEALQGEAVRNWQRRFDTRIPVVNGYGPTEGTVCATTYPIPGLVPADQANIPIGTPISNVQVYVMNRQMQLCPAGVVGELYFGSAGLAKGYHNKPEKTAEAFLPHPFATEPGQLLYKSGDMVRLMQSGLIEYVGRADAQVKVRGHRIEIGEIEETILAHPAVEVGAVIPAVAPDGTTTLFGFYQTKQDGVVEAAELKQHLSAHLPYYMVPAQIIRLDLMPLSPSGKVDRIALKKLAAEGEFDWQGEYVEPSTGTEAELAKIWSDVLRRDGIGRDAHFFDLGGHSLLATQVVNRIRKERGADISIKDLFAHPTLHELAAFLDEAGQGSAQAITRAPEQELYDLSNAQRRLFFLYKMNPNDLSYVIPGSVTLKGSLHLNALEQAMQAIIARHDALRTVFLEVDGVAKQKVLPGIDFKLRVHDLKHLPRDEQEQQAKALIHEDQQTPYSLENGPLLRALVFAFGEAEHRLFLSMHHIISDGWSVSVFFQELSEIYDALVNGGQHALPPLEIQYADYAHWQQENMRGGAWEDQEQYWLKTLAKPLPELELPSDFPRPAHALTEGDIVPIEFAAELVAELKRTAKEFDASLFMVLFAAYVHHLHALSGERDLIVGIPVAGRDQAALEPLVGFFLNNLAIRVQVEADDTVRDLVARVKTALLDAYRHQLYPFDVLVEKLNPERRVNRTPIYSTMFNMMNNAPFSRSLSGLEMSMDDVETAGAKYDLRIALVETEDGRILGHWEYSSHLFAHESCERMVDQYRTILESYVANADAALDEIELEEQSMDDLLAMFMQQDE